MTEPSLKDLLSNWEEISSTPQQAATSNDKAEECPTIAQVAANPMADAVLGDRSRSEKESIIQREPAAKDKAQEGARLDLVPAAAIGVRQDIERSETNSAAQLTTAQATLEEGGGQHEDRPVILKPMTEQPTASQQPSPTKSQRGVTSERVRVSPEKDPKASALSERVRVAQVVAEVMDKEHEGCPEKDDAAVAGGELKTGRFPRNRWKPITSEAFFNGKKVVIHPFLEGNNLKDLTFLKFLSAETPYKTGKGGVLRAWEIFAAKIKDARDDKGALVFGPNGPNAGTLRARFDQMMTFAAAEERAAKLRTGTDDESPPSELMELLEGVYADNCSFKAGGVEDAKAAKQRKKEREAVELIRNKSLGKFQRQQQQQQQQHEQQRLPQLQQQQQHQQQRLQQQRLQQQQQATDNDGCDSDDDVDASSIGSRTSRSRRSVSEKSSGEASNVVTIEERLQNRDRIREKHEDRKMAQIEYNSKKLALAEKRMDKEFKERERMMKVMNGLAKQALRTHGDNKRKRKRVADSSDDNSSDSNKDSS